MPSFTVYKGSESGKVVKATTEKPALKGDQVLLKVTTSGLCGTDLHYNHTDMGLGHEGVGIVEELGPNCTILKKGDRVGWGYEHDSCGSCQECLRGYETFCAKRALYGFADLDQGSMAEGAVWRESFLFKIPDDMSDEVAAPLMCGGATVFNALHLYNVRPTDVVGVMGVGGLGHLAIQYASKMGCRVVVFSGTDSKKEEAMRLGASEFVAMKGAKELKAERPINALLVTTSAQPDWKLIIPTLAPCATVFPLSVADGEFSIPYMDFLANGLTVQASLVASRYVQNRMLEFSAHHKITPIIEKFPLTEDGCNQAIEKLGAGDMRYRAVLVRQ